METATGKVYDAIRKVSAALLKEGIGKDRKNAQQNYAFRGIDDVYNALAPVLVSNNLVILPRCLQREVVERTTKTGGALFYVTLEVEFDIVCTEDGSKHTIKTFGEAMDAADKATNKAMSAAYKYAAIQAFCIPTEGDNDADATTHAVRPLWDEQLYKAMRAIETAKTVAEIKSHGLAAVALYPQLESQFLAKGEERKRQLLNSPAPTPTV
jgi:hypothetical protein